MSPAVSETALSVDVSVTSELWRGHEDKLAQTLAAAAQMENVAGEVSLLLGDDAAITALNRDFRGKDRPTNVLSFPPAGGPEEFIGDIALAAETIAYEAQFQGKSFEDHAAHLVVHGLLHLLSYDHETETEAEEMEARERDILAAMGIADPYA